MTSGVISTSPPILQIQTGGGSSQRPSPQAPPQPAPQPSTHTSASRSRPKIPPYRLTTLPIQTDMTYSSQTHTLSCSLELPGVHPSHLRVSLGTCYFNHVKYVGVVAESVPVFGHESVLFGGGSRADRSAGEEREEEEAGRGLTAEMVGGIRSRLRRPDSEERVGGGGGEDHVKIGRIVNPNLRERKFGIFRRFIQVPSHTTVSSRMPLFLACGFMIANVLIIVLSIALGHALPRSLCPLSLSLSPHSLLRCNQ